MEETIGSQQFQSEGLSFFMVAGTYEYGASMTIGTKDRFLTVALIFEF
jgi:hypothetical protein